MEAAKGRGAIRLAAVAGTLVLLIGSVPVDAAAPLVVATGTGQTGPADGPSLVLWLDAQDVVGKSGTSDQITDGTPIDRWADKSTYGNHAMQPAAGQRPRYVAADSKGRFCAVRFATAKQQYLRVADRSCVDLDQMTAFVVARVSASPNAMWLFGKNRFDGPWTGYGIAVAGGSSFPWPHLGMGGAGSARNGYVQLDTPIRDTFALVDIRCDGQRLRSAVNGRRTVRAVAGPIRENDRNLLIGAGAQAPAGSQFLDGDIAELLLYNRALKPGEQEKTRRYLVEKYGIELTEEDAPEQMVIIERSHMPVIVENPVTPKTSTRTPESADAVLVRDWMFQADNRPTRARAQQEIQWARQLASRLSKDAHAPDLAPELAELDDLEKQLADAETQAASTLYLAVRRVKRRIAMANPAVNFSRLLLIDQPNPGGGPEWRHEAVHRMGHRAIPGGRLLVHDGLHPGGEVRQLFPPEPGSFWRPELSFDGKRVLFCFKPHDEKSFHLYEINLDGTGLRQLTDSDYDDIDPIYLPDGHIMFTSTRGNTYVRCGPYIYSYVLARCDADGKNVYLVSTNSEPDFVPALLDDGRIVYSRWEYSDKDQNRVQSLWTTNQDGTGTAVFWGNQSIWPDHLAEPRPIPGTGRVMFTGVGHHNWFIGSIGIIDPKKGSNYPHGLTRVTWDLPWAEVGSPGGDRPESPHYHASGRFSGHLGAYPISEEDFLVSAKGPDSKFRAYLMDVHGNRELLYEGVHNAWYAIPIRPRPVPLQQPDLVDWPGTGENRKAKKPGLFYSADVCQGVSELPRGSVKYLRVFQQDAKTYSTWEKQFVFSGPAVSAVQSEAVKRIVSVVPVEADGSVYFEAPAGESLFFQLLDGQYRALHTMRSFSGVMPGERRGCVGCHKMHSNSPPRKPGVAMGRSPTKLSPPPWGTESIGYGRFVQPVLEQYCGECHLGDGKARKDFDLTERPATGKFQGHFTEPYLTLIGPAAWPVPIPDTGQPGYGLAGAFPVYGLKSGETYPNDPATDAKSAIWRTLRPMQYLSLRSRLIEMASNGKHYDVKADPRSLRLLIAWVDANCPYVGEEELRMMDDPEFPGIDQLPIRPRVKTAPVISRP
ncbi:MAG: hypothetical protein HQ581_02070 [Planctomycetes bacterium]|nr:hypothetical protein [Planctomycetota bacterium]